MKKNETIDRVQESILLCTIHHQRMMYAHSKVQVFFPLTEKGYKSITNDELSYIDQLIYRFSKLQDSMGVRMFPALLQLLGEDLEGKAFIDILLKLEKLNIIENHKDWLLLRETRNVVTHEYPFFVPEIIEGLNLLYDQSTNLSAIWLSVNHIAIENISRLK